MSRIGNTPITIPKDVTVTKNGSLIVVKGPKGELTQHVSPQLTVTVENNVCTIACPSHDRKARAVHGALRANINNSIIGVTQGWTRTLKLSGVGYRAVVNGVNLVLTVGFSHSVTITPPSGITFVVKEDAIVVSGIDKQIVGQVAADVREVKKPEPYKGKGIKYEGERIRKKAGKAKAVGGAPGSA